MNKTMFADIAYNGSFFEAPLHDNIHIFVGKYPEKRRTFTCIIKFEWSN